MVYKHICERVEAWPPRHLHVGVSFLEPRFCNFGFGSYLGAGAVPMLAFKTGTEA